MSDEADRANEQMEMSLALSLKRREKTLLAVGFCHFCESRLRDGVLFCEKACAVDYEHEQRLKKIKGQ
jgi:hypothetical protein